LFYLRGTLDVLDISSVSSAFVAFAETSTSYYSCQFSLLLSSVSSAKGKQLA